MRTILFLTFFGLTMINPAFSLAADWSGMTPESVCSKLTWTDTKKIVLVGAGMNVSDVNEVTAHLRNNLQGCTKVSAILNSEDSRKVSNLDDTSIVAKFSNLAVDLVLIVRVYPGLDGKTSMFASFFNTKAEIVSSISADAGVKSPAELSKQEQETMAVQERAKTEMIALEAEEKKHATKSKEHETTDTLPRKTEEKKPEFMPRRQYNAIPKNHLGREHRHDGLFLRLNLVGLGFGSASAKSGGDSVTVSGLAGLGELSIGYSVVENLALHFSINGPVMVDPDINMNGDSASTEDVTVSSLGFGCGLSYYFMPHNFYLTIILGTAKMVFEHQGESVETEYGFSFHASFGREWWVSPNWAIGVAGALIFQSMEDTGPPTAPTWTTVAGGVLLSATYN